MSRHLGGPRVPILVAGRPLCYDSADTVHGDEGSSSFFLLFVSKVFKRCAVWSEVKAVGGTWGWGEQGWKGRKEGGEEG